MALTILAIPLIILGVFIKPYSTENARCISISFAGARAYCFEQGSNLPEAIKYGSVLAGFGLLYAGRLQIKRQRNRL
jgi:ACR3 family arsenite efflux pump ArsB